MLRPEVKTLTTTPQPRRNRAARARPGQRSCKTLTVSSHVTDHCAKDYRQERSRLPHIARSNYDYYNYYQKLYPTIIRSYYNYYISIQLLNSVPLQSLYLTLKSKNQYLILKLLSYLLIFILYLTYLVYYAPSSFPRTNPRTL